MTMLERLKFAKAAINQELGPRFVADHPELVVELIKACSLAELAENLGKPIVIRYMESAN